MKSAFPDTYPKSTRIIRRTLAAAAVALTASCGFGGGESPDASTSSAAAATTASSGPQVLGSVQGTLNYDGLRRDGSCQGGGARPCFGPLRTTPHYATGSDPTSNWRNPGTFDAAGHYVSVSWPFEGDQLEIVCRVIGDDVSGFDTSIHSNIWDAVVVPPDRSRSGVAEVDYEPERWMRLPHGILLDTCSDAENPAHAPIAHTPTP